MDFFCESEDGIQFYDFAVVENAFSAESSEYLMGYHAEKFEIEGFVTVYDRHEIEFESAVRGREFPRRRIIDFIRSVAGYKEGDFLKLMSFSVVEKHVFARSRSVAETVADIETEFNSVGKHRLQTAPIPGVVVGPYSASPVERSERVVEGVSFVA